MSRLTVNDLDKVAYNAWELCGMDADCTADCEGCFVNAIYLKLAHYEDLEEQGRLVEQKHGQCKPTGNIEVLYAKEYACSVCGGIMLGKSEFCPNCGAKMLKGTEE